MENNRSEASFDSFSSETSFSATLPALYPPWKFELYTCGLKAWDIYVLQSFHFLNMFHFRNTWGFAHNIQAMWQGTNQIMECLDFLRFEGGKYILPSTNYLIY